MKIIQVSGVGYRRFNLTPALYEFTFKVDNLVSVILGGNGSGKSGLLELLCPHVVHKNTIEPGGHVELMLDHQGSNYRIRTTHGPKTYSFIRDNEELNKGHGITTQGDLIEKELGITKEIYNLMTDKVLFTKMSPDARKKWFLAMSDTDYAYVVDLFTRISKSANDNRSVLKYNQKRLSQLGTTVNTDAEEYKVSVKALTTEMDALIETKVPIIPLDDFDRKVSQSRATVNLNADKLLTETMRRVKLVAKLELSPDDLSLLPGTIATLRERIAVLEDRESTLKDQVIEVSNANRDNDVTKLPPKKKLLAFQKDMLHEIEDIHQGNPTSYTDPLAVIVSLKLLVMNISVVVDYLYPIKGNRRDVLDQHQQALLTAKNELTMFSDGLRKLVVEARHLDTLKESDSTDCPKCEYSWIPEYDSGRHESLLLKIKELTPEETRMTVELGELEAIIVTKVEEVKAEDEVRRLLTEHAHLEMYDLEDVESLLVNYSSIVSKINRHIIDTDLQTKLEIITDKLTQVEVYLSLHDKIDKQSSSGLPTEESLTRKLAEVSNNLHTAKSKCDEYAQVILMASRIDSLNESTVLAQTELTYLRETSATNAQQVVINSKISKLKSDIASLEHSITQHDLTVKTIESLAIEVKAQGVLDLDNKNIVKAISPKGGLLANSIFGFINTFIGNMNIFLEDIWTYPLVIQPPKITDDDIDLTYRFKLKVGDSMVDDVNEGSTAMLGVINLAFKLTVYHHLGIGDYPLFMDELGSGLDKAHRLALTRYVSETIVHSPHTNIFVVSQHADIYTEFLDNSTDYTILSKDNLDMSLMVGDYNKNLS